MNHLHHIRPARDEDFDQLCDLYEELDEHHRRARPDLFRTPSGPRRERSFVRSLIAGPDSTILVAQAPSGRLLGLSTVIIRIVPASVIRDERRFAEIDSLVVRVDARRRGIARALVQASAAWSSARGMATLELKVHEFNQDALAFYKAAGFTTTIRHMARQI
jgi:ribosomal protein S18 acetylase RimI-like enzyme